MLPRFLSTTCNRTRNLAARQLVAANEEKLYSNTLHKCFESYDTRCGGAIHAKLIKTWLPCSVVLSNHILNMYVKCGLTTEGIRLFDEMPERNVVSWSAIIAGFVQHGFHEEALSLFSRMHYEGVVRPNQFTLVSALHACSLSECLLKLYQVYAYVFRVGFDSNVFMSNVFMTGLIRHGKILEAKLVFDYCVNKDIVSWNAMMAGLSQHSFLEVAGFWWRMSREGIKPNNFTFSTVLNGLAAASDVEMGLQVHGQLVKSGHGAEVCVGNSLCELYVKNGMLLEGYKAFSEMNARDVCSWTQMAIGFLHHGEPGKVLELVAQMRAVGVIPNKFTLPTVLNACANLALLEEGKKFHGLRVKLGSSVDVCVDNALLDMYAKVGCMDRAQAVFKSMCERSVVSWTTMIMGFAQNSQPREALEVFEDMRLWNVEPNHITFVCVLYACSQGGFIEQGWRYFTLMSTEYGISPVEVHYVCMVNLLGRAGRVSEAEELVKSMPFEPGVLVWQTLLGACQLHGDIETGKRAAERAMAIDGKDPSTYVLLSNMFAGLQNWDTARMVRKTMMNRDVNKMPGSSWIDINTTPMLSNFENVGIN